MELAKSYLRVLRTPEIPSHRVVRKTAVLCALLCVGLVYYRHWVLDLLSTESFFVTGTLAFVLFGVVGIFGGLLSAAFYEAFLKDVGALTPEPSVTTFFAEWLFAVSSPLIGLVAFGALNAHPH